MTVKLSVQNASFGYGNNENVWENINIDINDGDCFLRLLAGCLCLRYRNVLQPFRGSRRCAGRARRHRVCGLYAI